MVTSGFQPTVTEGSSGTLETAVVRKFANRDGLAKALAKGF
jgi:hypothetical protein